MRAFGKLKSLCAVDECARKASCSLKDVMFHTSIEAELNALLSREFLWNYFYLVKRNHRVSAKYELRNCAILICGDAHKQKEL